MPLTFNVWGNVNLDDWDGQVPTDQFSEIDLTLTAELPKGFTLGYIEYAYPTATGDPSTREFFAGWSHEFSLATPSVTLYYDVAEIDSGFLLRRASSGSWPSASEPPSS